MKAALILAALNVVLSQTPATEHVPADVPIPRSDANSKIAHEELLKKAKSGRIDVYFVGDSITRRWGATDYPELLANWKQNFFGWNAANFGWGGDTTNNILWRLLNGELDGVHPKIVVIQGGTNNLARVRPDADREQVAEDVVRGIQAILRVVQEKAPGAVIVLTALFPRNDRMHLMPIIDRINEKLATLADGRKVRFININDQLMYPEGKIKEGMMNPDLLHPTIRTYQIWADALKPIFTEILGPPGKEDFAPPPTGDPSKR